MRLAALLVAALIADAGCSGLIDDDGGGGGGGGGGGNGTGSGGGGAGDSPDAGSGEECLPATSSCESTDECCDDLECGTTTLGQVCCGQHGASCATDNGEDCCGDLLCTGGVCGDGTPGFQAPFTCGERWTFSHHDAEVRLALDFIRDDGGETSGAPVLASAGGVASLLEEPGGAGNYVVIDHGGGWTTYYFHLSSFSVGDGAEVVQGDEVGKTGTTGASSGPHIHYEQLLDGVGQEIRIAGDNLAPYPPVYGQRSLTSDNACR